MTTPDTKAIRALKSKRSKCADVGNIDLSNVPESHETIWLQWGDNGGDDDTWCVDNINDDDVPYIRADLVFALCDENERLLADREQGGKDYCNMMDQRDALHVYAKKLEAALPLRPFVEYVHDDFRRGKATYELVATDHAGGELIGAEDLRRARAAIAQKGGE